MTKAIIDLHITGTITFHDDVSHGEASPTTPPPPPSPPKSQEHQNGPTDPQKYFLQKAGRWRDDMSFTEAQETVGKLKSQYGDIHPKDMPRPSIYGDPPENFPWDPKTDEERPKRGRPRKQ